MPVTRCRVIVTGRVQGVAYRANALKEAMRLQLTGWVKNREDGRVEALVEGPDIPIDAFIEWCKKGSQSASVDAVEILERTQGDRQFKAFEISF